MPGLVCEGSAPQHRRRVLAPAARRGFTLIELLLVLSMIATLASLAVPQFDKVRDRGRATEAIADLKNLESEILAYFAVNGSVLPVDLAEIGQGGKLDPWGNAYVYTPFSTSITYGCQGGGDGGGGNGGGGNGGGGNGGGGNGVGGNGGGGGGNGGGGGGGGGTCNGPPPSGARKDKFLVPVNSDFDLFSSGPDGAWEAPFTADPSRDDIVRAGNGGFFGVAEQF